MVGDIKNSIIMPFFGIVYIIAIFIVVIQHFSGLDFGALGLISWTIVILGTIGFVIYIISCASNSLGIT